ncbi:MAG TPA: MFS transporter, partial [Thermoleophilaceae bacterium]|nr:MFS transporter [Thermoleophilaceae bacterium]
LARIPLGILSDRHGARPVFTLLMAWTLLPLIALAVVHDSYAVVIVLGFLLGFAGASFAVGVPFVSRWYPPERQGYPWVSTGSAGAQAQRRSRTPLTLGSLLSNQGFPRCDRPASPAPWSQVLGDWPATRAGPPSARSSLPSAERAGGRPAHCTDRQTAVASSERRITERRNPASADRPPTLHRRR